MPVPGALFSNKLAQVPPIEIVSLIIPALYEVQIHCHVLNSMPWAVCLGSGFSDMAHLQTLQLRGELLSGCKLPSSRLSL